ncbi:gene transfer agent family protein [Mesorhizobium sp. M7A.F.Ca.CA.001.07.2.1]|uniref:gene transfer agent family protein n=1 Tax=Mesorhizobium TaxID=68287 RepID=UPI000FCCCDF9|nr:MULTISPECIES: gene transfer agent family protein [Mesorhizobium]RVB40038.1 gene transfer agent family protein [Mesorhizobium sp. M7A.F.Ca.CA.004.05.1.1]MCF6126068.1 gene transfer agent family protein [Mesorhizobium ciceri]MCQ8813897.1 gene transfer agent family protein [Mesorhizobium sp. SEMIA396]RUX79318.1 gene transfer agent family protein [Mesorhizobium sp. M7A.F.Ca.CA.004.08.2.1]RUX89422.1 gene transfer agent family protein [Mesorhizobium sp. M7A.F.Ca.CA.004.08.1.1]
MSRDARVTLDFADGTYPFRVGWGEFAELQEKTDAGPFVVLGRLMDRTCRTTDISNVIRLGLIGGGMEPAKALTLVRSYVEDRPPAENLPIAQAILMAACMGAPDEAGEPKKKSQEDEGVTLDDLPNGKVRFEVLYGYGQVMGYSPQQVNGMSIWQFHAVVEGFRKSQSGSDRQLSEADKDALWDWLTADAAPIIGLQPKVPFNPVALLPVERLFSVA